MSSKELAHFSEGKNRRLLEQQTIWRITRCVQLALLCAGLHLGKPPNLWDSHPHFPQTPQFLSHNAGYHAHMYRYRRQRWADVSPVTPLPRTTFNVA